MAKKARPKNRQVTISPHNSKMGSIPSASTPAGVSCPSGILCYLDCYARKMAHNGPRAKGIAASYAKNWQIWLDDPEDYFQQIAEAAWNARFFRWHVSGDIPTADYLRGMTKVAQECPDTLFLAFTKAYSIVNDLADMIPENLRIVFSRWPGMPCNNPHRFPEAHVDFHNGACEAPETAYHCPGYCADCNRACSGCWHLKRGAAVVIDKH